MYNYPLHLLTYLTIKKKKIFGWVSLRRKKRCTPFIILSEPRSGSTLLHTYLNFHPQIISHGEVLREQLENNFSEQRITKFLVRYIFDFWSPTIRAVGLKLFYDYRNDLAYQPCFTAVHQKKDVAVIHLVRKDSLKLFTSLKIAQKNNVWSTGESTPRNEKIYINPEEYLKFSVKYIKDQQEFDELFKDHRQLKILYEDLVDNPIQVLESIQLFLGVKPRRLFTLLKKQNTSPLETIILNYNEIKKIYSNRSDSIGSSLEAL